MIRRAEAAAGGPLLLIASPWSPPAWMKDTGSMLFAEAFKAAGVPLWAFTVQNEPLASTPWENCIFSAEEERDFVRDFLGPSLEAANLGMKLLVWDHNRDDMWLRAHTIYSDPAAAK